MAQDWAMQQARKALQVYRRGSQINAGCVEIYDTVAEAIRAAYKRGEAAEREACAAICDHRAAVQGIRMDAELNDYARERAAEADGCARDIRNRT